MKPTSKTMGHFTRRILMILAHDRMDFNLSHNFALFTLGPWLRPNTSKMYHHLQSTKNILYFWLNFVIYRFRKKFSSNFTRWMYFRNSNTWMMRLFGQIVDPIKSANNMILCDDFLSYLMHDILFIILMTGVCIFFLFSKMK